MLTSSKHNYHRVRQIGAKVNDGHRDGAAYSYADEVARNIVQDGENYGHNSPVAATSEATMRGQISTKRAIAVIFTDQAPGAKKMSIEENGSEMITGRIWATITGVRLRLPHRKRPPRINPKIKLKIKLNTLNPQIV